MASLRPAFSRLGGRSQTSTPQWQQLRQLLRDLHLDPKGTNTRPFATLSADSNTPTSRDDFAASGMVGSKDADSAGIFSMDEALRQIRGADRKNDKAAVAGDLLALIKGGFKVHARAVPVSPSYFSRQPEFNDSFLELQKLMRKYSHLPTAPSDQLTKVAFRTLKDYRLAVGEDIKASDYAKCMTLVKKLHRIHPSLLPKEVEDAIAKFKRDINPHNHKTKEIPIDRFGRALGVGKRKTSTARAWVVEGTGEVLVNGKSLADAFGRIHDRDSAVWALKSTARTDKYNVWALVDGGGTTGQAEALAMAVGKALLAHEPALKPALRRGKLFSHRIFQVLMLIPSPAGVVTRDPRGVERKKHGHVKARKKPTWVKR